MRRSGLWSAGFVLLGLLGVVLGMIALGRTELQAFPSATSYLPSGASAFAEVLRRQGLTVVDDRNTSPELRDSDLAIVFLVLAPAEMDEEEEENELETAPWMTIRQHVHDGGRALILPLDYDFQAASLRAVSSPVQVVRTGAEDSLTISFDPQATPDESVFPEDAVGKSLWTMSGTNAPFTEIQKRGKGIVISARDGLPATNRFLDKEDNAIVMTDLVRNALPTGGRVVFVEAAIGNSSDRSLVSLIGPWAEAAWYQVLFLLLVVAYTLGKPFGLADPSRREERGSRELLDAITDTMKRGRMSGMALQTLRDETDRVLRRWFPEPRETRRIDPEAASMLELHHALRKVDAAIELKAPEFEALRLATEVERLTKEVADFGSHGLPGAR